MNRNFRAAGLVLLIAALTPAIAEANHRRHRANGERAGLVVCNPNDVVARLFAPCPRPRVLRVRPASYVKTYPFGRLREDYTPYGMIGVAPHDYFDVIEGRRRK